MLEGNGEKKEMNWRIVNIQHVTLNEMKELAKLFMSIGVKGGLSQKRT